MERAPVYGDGEEKVGLSAQVGHDGSVARVSPARTTSRRLAAAALLLALVAPSIASADPTPTDLADARALFAEAVADEQAGRWSEAALKLRRASAVKMTPGLRFHLALCDERLGHLVAAKNGYAAAQMAARAANNREVLDLVADPLEQLRVRIPTVTVNLPARHTHGPSAAVVRVDGATLDSAAVGAPVQVDVGSHTIQATAPGQTPYAITFTVVERQAATIDIQFLPLSSGGTGDATQSVVPIAPAVPVVALLPVAPAAPASTALPREARHPDRTLAVVTTVGAVVLVAGGVGAFAAAGSDQSSYEAECRGRGPSCGNATAVRALDATALTAWIAGAGAGVAAVVLWTRAPDGSHAELRGGPGSISLTGTF